MAGWLLVHSPLLGPASWAPVASELWDAGETVLVPDLRPALTEDGDFSVRQAELAAAVANGPVIAVGHSGGGPLLPAVATALAGRGVVVERCVFVDAGLPHPGRYRRSTLRDELAAQLDDLVADGWLPPWPSWWPPDALAELMPDAALRTALEADCPRLPMALFDEPLPIDAGLPPSGYLQLSEAYAAPAEDAAADGWPVVRLAADHLAILTRPDEVAAAMRAVATDATVLRNAARRHVARFNRAVRERDWARLTNSFAPDAVMRFTNVPVGPFSGRGAIEQAYRDQPPDDTMTVRAIDETGPDTADVAFAWDAGGTGVMRLRWVDDLVVELTVTFT
jgi:hypothetical protein